MRDFQTHNDTRWCFWLMHILVFILGFFSEPHLTFAQESPHPQDKIQRVVAVIPKDFPPQYFLNSEGEPQGFAIDVLEAVAQKAQLQVTYSVADNWPEVEQTITSGNADVIPNMGITPQRMSYLAFTEPVETFAVKIFVRDNNRIAGIEDLSKKKVALVRTNVAEDLYGHRTDWQITLFEDVRQALFDLLSGKVDALIFPEPVVLKMLQETGLEDRVKSVGPPLLEIKRALAVRRDNQALFEKLSIAVREFTQTEAYKKVYIKWYGPPHPFWNTNRVAWGSGSVIVVLICGFMFWRYQLLIRYNDKLNQTVKEREATAKELRERQDMWAKAEQVAQVGSWHWDFRSNKVTWSDGMFMIFGINPADFSGDLNQIVSHCVHPDDQEKVRQTSAGVFEKKEPQPLDFRVLWSNGQCRTIWAQGDIIYDDEGHPTGYLGHAQDITERQIWEKELQRINRLQAVGELAAGVSHNLNNMLVGIMGPAQMLEKNISDPDAPLYVQDILQASGRARDLVRKLHFSVRGSELENLESVNVNEIIEEALVVTKPRWQDESDSKGIKIQITRDFGQVKTIRGTEIGFHEIMVNLIFNALDAMTSGGELRIQTRESNKGVTVTISDTGIGMDEQVQTKIFEPFFTTKSNVGTGLGLSTVYKMVTSWDGTIELESTPGQGTQFHIWLPECDLPSQLEITDSNKSISTPLSGNLLIIEDDRSVSSVLTKLFQTNYHTQIAHDGRQGIHLFSQSKYDVVMIDLGLPELTGDAVARKIRAKDKHVALILTTGWQLTEVTPRMSDFDFTIQKPFLNIHEVENVVQQAIELNKQRKQSSNQQHPTEL